jgi:hypothetical protein
VTENLDHKVEHSDGSPHTFKRKLDQANKDGLEELDEFEQFQQQRNQNLKSLNKIVGRLIKKGFKSSAT